MITLVLEHKSTQRLDRYINVKIVVFEFFKNIQFNVFRCVHNKDCIATVDDFIFDEELDKTLSSCHKVDIRSLDVLDDSICCKEEQTRCTTLPNHR